MTPFMCMALSLFFECGVCSEEEMVLVADVILSSVEADRYEETICKVVEEPGRFSYQKVLTTGQVLMPWQETYRSNWDKALVVTNKVLSIGYSGAVALCFHRKDISPGWALLKNRLPDTPGFYHHFYLEC